MGTIIAKCTENLLKAHEKDAKKIDLNKMVSFHTDALALLGHSQHELSLKRREAIKPSLKKEYAALCSTNVPVTSLLFGDDLQQGSSSSASDIIMQSWRTSTRVQYSSYIKKWLEYCHKWQINPISPPVASGLNFLAELYHKGLSYSALNTARSALASVIVLQGNQSFGNHPLVSCFLKGTFTTRPALPKYKEVWDVNTVLEHFKTLHPAEILPLKLLSLKIVMLMAILSGQCCQTIHALTTKDMKVSEDKVMFIVNDLLKTTKPGKECTKLEFLSFDEDPRICVVRYLSE